jgi:phosphoribosylanthranilate isomerase
LGFWDFEILGFLEITISKSHNPEISNSKSMSVRVKICCIASAREAKMAIDAGASAIGLVARMPSGPGPIADELIAEIAKTIPSHIDSFLLTCEQSSFNIIEHIKRAGTTTVQIVDELTEGSYQHIRDELPQIKIVQVLHVGGEETIDEALKLQEHVDYFLLDSGNPKAEIKTLGGTGNVHDWKISRKLIESVDVPVFLAGGLNAENVRQAIEIVQPYGVDLCSGVRDKWKVGCH